MRSTLLTLHDPQMARVYYGTGQWGHDTLYSLAASHEAERPHAYALRDARHRLTWAALMTRVEALAGDLESVGLRPGDRVGVWMGNKVEAVITFLACSRNGYVVTPSLHQNHTVAEVVTLMERCNAAVLIAQPGYGADADRHDIFAAAGTLPSMRRIYALSDKAHPGAVPFPSPGGARPLTPPQTNPDKVVYLAFTSGTTGQPKGVMHSDNTLLANGRALVSDWKVDEHTVIYSLSPLSHHIATVALEQFLVSGAELVVNDIPKGVSPLERIIETGATYVMGVPTHAIDILGEMDRWGLEKLGAVKTFYMAGAAIPIETARRFLDIGVLPQNVYGMTENGSHQYTMPDDALETMIGTCGKACAAYEVKIWSSDNIDIEAAPGAVGEIGGRGACLMLGYFGNQATTESSFNAAGWFMSGDLGSMDAQGNLAIIGRSKDLIIRGGHNIYPSQIEDLALRHPALFKVAAYPVKDDRLGERVCLAVILREGRNIDPEVILAHLFEVGLSKYDMPEYFIVLDVFPLTASGKVLKRQLVEWTNAGEIKPIQVRFVTPATAKEA